MRRPFIAENYGDFISISKENIVLKNKDSAETTPLKEISHVVIKGTYISFSSALILKCLKRGIPIILLDNLGRPYSVISELKRASDSKERQISFSKSHKSINFVCKLLKEKVRRQHQVLHYHIRSLRLAKNENVKIIEGYDFKSFLRSFDTYAKRKIPIREISQDIFLLEARSSRAYWKAFLKLFPKSDFPGRKKRNSEDPINKLLNYGYALLSSLILKTVVFASLDPNVPLFHHRKGLTFPFIFDLMEPFRPLADHTVISFFHKQKKQILGKNGEIRKSVLRRFRRFWFENTRNPQPWSKSEKQLDVLIAELMGKYKRQI